MNKQQSKEILTILEQLIPNPICELNFNNTFELLCAVSLSAQTTDKRVNEVTPYLFNKYPTPYQLAGANIEDVINTFKNTLGVVVVDEIPTSTLSNNSDFVYVGRIRKDKYYPNTLLFYCVADNIRRGAAYNAVKIALKINERKIAEK